MGLKEFESLNGITAKRLKILAAPAGLEPATIRLEGGCSIQLSYGAGYRGRSS